MNVLVIPSWYPSLTLPFSGIFIKEQADAIASLCPDIRMIVSTWGFDDGSVPVRQPRRAIASLKWRLAQKHDQVRERDGVWEVFNPCLNWSGRLAWGGMRRLIEVNRRNCRLAAARFGKLDLIHAHVSYPAGHVARILAREIGVPFILTEHMGPFPFPSLLDATGRPRGEIVGAFNHAAARIAVSPPLAASIASFDLPHPMVIPNLVDERRFVPGNPSGEKFAFLTLCAITELKGIDHLIKAIAVWDPPAARFEFRIGGAGPMRKEYEELARQLGVADRVRWIGAVSREEAPALFRDCHVYVMPSRHETFGIVYAEAIASGKPVIATRCGGPESIVNESNGRMVDVGDVDALASTMQWMEENWSSFSPAAIREDFEKRFSRRAVVEQLSAVYRSLVVQ